MHNKWYIIILLSLGLLTRFLFFGHPNETVFDEVHFGKFISGYYTGEYFFDIHPPLGKLAIAGFAKIFDFQPGFAFAEIGNKYPDKQYQILRFLPSLTGALLPSVIFLLALEMGLAPIYAFTAGLLIVFDNAILTQSRYILMDAFLLLVGFLALLFYFHYQKSKNENRKSLILFGLFSGLAISIKWTGAGFLALPVMFQFFLTIKEMKYKKVVQLLYPVVIAFAVYFFFFAVHLYVLDRSGPGDAFMSQGFQKTLAGNINQKNNDAKASNLFQKFTELNTEMYKANQRLNAEHPYSSPWYSWPLMIRPIYYWVNDNARIYLIGNPIIWWLAGISILYSIILRLNEKLIGKKEKINRNEPLFYFLLGGYIINLLPFIGVKRVMFLYHYFIALIFSIFILAYILNGQKASWKIVVAIMALVLASFIYFAPLNYGLELSPDTYENHVWLKSWK